MNFPEVGQTDGQGIQAPLTQPWKRLETGWCWIAFKNQEHLIFANILLNGNTQLFYCKCSWSHDINPVHNRAVAWQFSKYTQPLPWAKPVSGGYMPLGRYFRVKYVTAFLSWAVNVLSVRFACCWNVCVLNLFSQWVWVSHQCTHPIWKSVKKAAEETF